MTLRWGPRQRDRLLAVTAAVFAASLVAAARSIEDSLLADAVGAGGVPQGVGLAMAAAAVALFVKSFIDADVDAAADTAAGAAAKPWRPTLLRTAALVLILVIYGVLLPLLGYPLTVSLLVGASGWLAGAAPRWPLALCALVAGPALWLLFDRLLQVRMPVGTLWS